MFRIAPILDPATLTTLQEALGDPDVFQDGRVTAGRAARAVKDNTQIKGGGRHSILAKAVETSLRQNALFMAAARPKVFARLVFSRYEPGQAYGTHLDDPIIDNRRTDLSFTLFLTDPADYDGGALVIEDRDGETAVKLDAGALVLYPSTALHRVEPVTRGVRLACVGWVRSLIRLDQHRDILLDLEMAAQSLFERDGKSPLYDRVARARDNLIRLWAED